MSTYFFDTSALVKRYHRETGTEIVDAAFDDKNVTKTVSDISVIEFYSAFAKKVRAREITDEDFQVAVRVLAQDIRSGTIELTALNDEDKKEAVILIEKHGSSRNLRTLDAMQMAVLKRLWPKPFGFRSLGVRPRQPICHGHFDRLARARRIKTCNRKKQLSRK